jgi:hypothetical protein
LVFSRARTASFGVVVSIAFVSGCPLTFTPARDDASTETDGAQDFDAGIDRDTGSGDREIQDGSDAGTSGLDPSRCGDAQRFPTRGWEARTFSLGANNTFESCLGVADVAADQLDRDLTGLPGLPARFGTRYTATRTFSEGVETFSFTYADGIRIFLNGAKVEERMMRGAGTVQIYRTQFLQAGVFEITIEHIERQTSAHLTTTIERGCGGIVPSENEWAISYVRLLANGTIDRSTCYGTENRTSDQLMFDYGTGRPDLVETAGVNGPFAAIGVARRNFRGTTRFQLSHDQGLKLSANAQAIYDAQTTASDQIRDHRLNGAVDLAFELRASPGHTAIEIAWQNVCDLQLQSNDSNWAVRYYSVYSDQSGYWLNYDDCLYAELVGGMQLDFDWAESAPDFLAGTLGIVDFWGAEFSAERDFGAGATISATHDDGLRVLIGGTEVYANWGAPLSVMDTVVNTVAGRQMLLIRYFEQAGSARLGARW